MTCAAANPLHVLYLGYNYQEETRSPEELLERYTTVTGWANALAERGAAVTVALRFRSDASFHLGGVRYEFASDLFGPRLRRWQVPIRLHRAAAEAAGGALRQGCDTVAHCNGLHYGVQWQWLRRALPRDCAMVIQHHAERPPQGLYSQPTRWGLRSADGFVFAATPMAEPWRERRLIATRQPVFEIMEGSTHFRRGERAAARARSGMRGSPVVLWVKRLNPLADPLTVLDGFERSLREVPEARLYMVYSACDLLPQVRARIAASPRLGRAVVLVGEKPHAELHDIYNSADYFVLGSHYEGSGYSLAEAMACGVVPVVTSIPSFLMMTDNGRIGACWKVGDAASFREAFLRARQKPLPTESAAAAAFFEQRLSFPAIAERALVAYRDACRRRAEAR